MSIDPEEPEPSDDSDWPRWYLAAHRKFLRIALFLVAPVTFVLAATALRTHWSRVGQYGTTGDEPKYLGMAKGLWIRHSLQVRGVDIREFSATNKQFPTPQARAIGLSAHSYFTNHGLGLPFVIGPAVRFDGNAGARAVMVCIAAVIPAVVYLVLRCEGCRRGRSALLAVALGVSAPL